MLILNRHDVSASLSHAQCVDVVESAMKSVSQRNVVMPLRQFIGIPQTKGKFTMMPGYIQDPKCFGVKLVSKYPPVEGSELGSHIGAVMVFDADTGVPKALLDGGELTAIRTSAASALATKVLARKESKTLTVMGYGDEAWHHILAILAVTKLDKIIIWGRSCERATKLIEKCQSSPKVADNIEIVFEIDAQAAVSVADIVCTVTSSTQPILEGKWLQPGTHVNLVGAAIRTSSEADSDVVTRAKFYIDYKESAMAQAGELLDAIDAGLIDENHIVGEIGDVLLGNSPGRESGQEITVYKSLGVSAQDLAAGVCAFNNAMDNNIGVSIDW
ncbi:ornithine cyclodeaminase family protein [Aliiglaciecola sp. SL4]|uniref:ornithine cyclodeaminase family protein n=1 Tax=Aliiglaciecola sp. SL4 TaxID=3239806 RepID=UPI00355BD3A7